MGGGGDDDVSVGGAIAGSAVFGTLFGCGVEAFKAGPAVKGGVIAQSFKVNYAEVFNSVGRTSLQFAMLGGLYSGGAVVSRGIRDKDDALNYGAGGLLAGAFLGMRAGSLHQVVLKGVTVGAAGVLCAFLSSKLSGNTRPADIELSKRFGYATSPAEAEGKK